MRVNDELKISKDGVTIRHDDIGIIKITMDHHMFAGLCYTGKVSEKLCSCTEDEERGSRPMFECEQGHKREHHQHIYLATPPEDVSLLGQEARIDESKKLHASRNDVNAAIWGRCREKLALHVPEKQRRASS